MKYKRKFYNQKDYFLDEKNQVVILSEELFNTLRNKEDKFTSYKKIGGSTVGDVLEVGHFNTQFSAFCHITRLKMDVLQKKYINAGTILEPKIFDVLRETFKGLSIVNYSAKDYNYDYFAGKDEIIGGVPDGYIPSKNMILEIKTTGAKNYETWNKKNDNGDFENIPANYIKQAQLYSYLIGADKYSIVAAFLEEDKGDYENPENVDLSQRRIANYTFKVNLAETRDDINKIKDWYFFYTNTLTSPKYDLTKDKMQVDYLRCKNEQEWEELLNKWKEEGKADLDVVA
ncbi:hypothetical protein [Mycoplasma phage sp.]|uniref:YqaJ viral recombinase domain-containing protein n=1 Tax=Mycoplasma anserisalpingitidis TaxID=519450 RepID=A0A8F2DF46_9MOLU|nr:hypothetical protein [Mycoplasma phage sp.]QRI44074.1 hypothetical protein [Mycoplasma phage sp.]QWS78881.1 hypothetical protein [Mycoplasma anserisalpingitidis]QWS78903.1 hypothetical protein [Mycoplasma anserisalpingitidis]